MRRSNHFPNARPPCTPTDGDRCEHKQGAVREWLRAAPSEVEPQLTVSRRVKLSIDTLLYSPPYIQFVSFAFKTLKNSLLSPTPNPDTLLPTRYFTFCERRLGLFANAKFVSRQIFVQA